jgi:2-oxoglutarate dehydrogenase E1 component
MTSGTQDSVDTTDFGPNVWLIDEMYSRFLDSPASVSEAWREFFDDYRPHGSRAEPERPSPPAPPPPGPAPVQGAGPGSDGQTPPQSARQLKGITATIARRMDESLNVPTATSMRTVPAKLLEVNRLIVNNQLKRLTQGGKISFTHLIGYAVVRALRDLPELNVGYAEFDGKPYVVHHDGVNLGLAVDVQRPDGSRVLLVPNVKHAERLGFKEFWLAYEEIVQKARSNRLSPDDFASTTVSLTNPGTIGTGQSVPRLMPDQGLIVGVGAIAFPPEYQAADPGYLARHGIGRVVTLTSTYDHRVIQGAQSGELLRRIHELVLGADGFYDDVFESLGVPYTPAQWATDDNPPTGSAPWAEKQANVFRLINAYRVRGHLIADLDPLRQQRPRMYPELDPRYHGLTLWDLDREFATGGMRDQPVSQLGVILSVLRDSYCRTIGIEYMHMQDTTQKLWVQQRAEAARDELDLAAKIDVLHKLNQAEAFERFLHTKYVGHKRFGLEGAESLIPLLGSLLYEAAGAGMEEAVLGMAHRGRLNVLANIVGKSYERIFREFEGDLDPETTGGTGDVKYHLGATGKYQSGNGPITVHLVANPSHLEAVDPVLEGVARAKQERRGGQGHTQVLPVLIHGDAAFAGQGVVVETLNLSQLRGYRTGGTVHVVVNNQVGFTTSALDARSSFYATDVAKTVQAPIIHVNGDDPEAVVRAAAFAFAFREAFHKDVVIDMICYRRRGHNEGDEPSYTQPVMYKIIENHRSVRKLYMERLVNTGEISVEEGEALLDEFRELMETAFRETRTSQPSTGGVSGPAPEGEEPATAVPLPDLAEILRFVTSPPDGFELHPKLEKVVADRAASLAGGAVDWGTAEALALGSLAREGVPIRLAGEDSRRGTFSHRHAQLVDYSTGADWAPLELLTAGETRVRIVDSLLSEFAAVGFEYGYSVEWPEALVVWEAQFGDFANGAQVIIDQFIAAGEAKWGQQSGLTLLLPHGHEGQGPEHSSARIERFLDLCADDNLRVVVPATSGQYFHLLRRQAHLRPRRPLIVFTPKSLLRTKASFSAPEVLGDGAFRPLVDDDQVRSGARRVVLCAGKVYHDLAQARFRTEPEGVAIARVAQLYPLPHDALADLAARHPDAELVWCQEEPENQGAYRFLWHTLRDLFGREPAFAGRRAAASPATGSSRVHAEQQKALVEAALGM